jgi:RNA polymerase sigma-70 factor (ECF subfamily)
MSDSEERRKLDDAELVRRGRAGDRKAFEELFGRYERGLFSFVRRFVGGSAEPEDVYQEVLLKAMTNIGRYNVNLSFRTWLFTLAANHCKNVLRSRDQRGKFRAPWTRKASDEGEIDVLDIVSSDEPDPEKDVETSEFMGSLERELGSLPPPQREVFILREFNGFSFKEIAAILKVPEATARSRMFLAVDRLRTRLRRFSLAGSSQPRAARRH